jgi:hypothetical protein
MIFLKAWRFLKKWWWTFVLGAATVLSVVGGALFLSARKKEEEHNRIDSIKKPSFKERAATQIERVHLEGEVERARIETRYKERKSEIDEIEEIGKEDPAEARKRLAEWLTNNL